MSALTFFTTTAVATRSERRLSHTLLHVLCCAFLLAGALFGQRAAEIAGGVVDASGSAVPGVQVNAINVATGVQNSTLTNDVGLFRFVEMVVGTYRLEAAKPGFKTSFTTLVLEGGRTTTVNIAIDVGEVSTRVEVQAVAPTLETQSQTVSNVVEEKLIKSLPVPLRRGLQLLNAAAAVSFNGSEPTTTQTPFFTVAGGFGSAPTAYIDGGNATNTRAESNVLTMNPNIEVTNEFRLVQVGYKAEYGGGGTGLVLMTTKSGTNEYHGALWEFHRNQALDARNWFAPQKAPFREHIYGGAIGGPIRRNKVFFFGTYEGTRNKISNLTGAGRGLTAEFFQTLPTVEQRNGDFSGKFNRDGTLRQIFDPMSTRVVDGRIIRDAFAGNIIPANRISPIAQRVLSKTPMPNRAPIDLTGTNNFSSTSNTYSTTRNAVTGRVDYDHSASDKFFYRLLWDDAPFQYDGPWPGDPDAARIRAVSGDTGSRNPYDPDDMVLPVWSRMHLGAWTHILNPSLINDMRFAYNTRSWGGHHSSAGLGLPGQFGIPLPTPVAKTLEKFGDPNDAVPNFNVAGYRMPGNGWLGAGDYQLPMRDWNFIESLTWVKSSHQFKMGYETRRSAGTMYTHLNWTGNYNFTNRGTARDPNDAASGDSFASFLVDWPESGNYKSVAMRHFWQWWHSFYFQDDWRVSRNLTFNLGLRYEFDTAMREGLGSSRCTVGAPFDWNGCKDRIIGFNDQATNPVSGTPGVVTFPTSYYDTDWNNFQPRVGFAWNIAPNTVIRGGAGMFHSYPMQWGLRGAPGDVRPDVATVGDFISTDLGVTAPFRMSAGMPAPPPFSPDQLNPGFGAVPVGQSPRLALSYLDRNLSNPYGIQFDLNVQHQLNNGLFFELGWIANNGKHIFGGLNRNQMRIEDVQRVAAQGRNPTQADRPFPQFTGVTEQTWPFSSNYNAVVFKVEKRYAAGLTFISHYTFSKHLDDTGPQDIYNRKQGKGPSSNMIAHRFVYAGSWDIPFGIGRPYMNRGILAHVIGGWTISPFLTVESGRYLTPSASPNLCNCFGSQWADRLDGVEVEGPKTIDAWFNLAAFTHPGVNRFGNTGRGVIVGPGVANLDLSLAKDVRFTERYVLALRGEFFNFTNHANWGNPSTSIFPVGAAGTTNVITSAREPRRIQIGLRFQF